MNQTAIDNIVSLLMISMLVSSIVMVIIQKFKQFSFITKEYQIGIINILASFLLGIPFTVYFFDMAIIDSCWISFFSIIGAPTIYSILKKQNFINYKPESLNNDYIGEIRRDD